MNLALLIWGEKQSRSRLAKLCKRHRHCVQSMALWQGRNASWAATVLLAICACTVGSGAAVPAKLVHARPQCVLFHVGSGGRPGFTGWLLVLSGGHMTLGQSRQISCSRLPAIPPVHRIRFLSRFGGMSPARLHGHLFLSRSRASCRPNIVLILLVCVVTSFIKIWPTARPPH